MSAAIEAARNQLLNNAMILGDKLAKHPNGDASNEASALEAAAIEYRNMVRRTSGPRTIVDVKAGLRELRESSTERPWRPSDEIDWAASLVDEG